MFIFPRGKNGSKGLRKPQKGLFTMFPHLAKEEKTAIS
jgi:hypothetical protein